VWRFECIMYYNHWLYQQLITMVMHNEQLTINNYYNKLFTVGGQFLTSKEHLQVVDPFHFLALLNLSCCYEQRRYVCLLWALLTPPINLGLRLMMKLTNMYGGEMDEQELWAEMCN
jgi:hypothetical protein